MRTCPKCGRANQPTRKYCTRCGASLLSMEKKPQTVSEPAATTESKVAETSIQATPASESKVTTNDEWIKPSQVSRDRVRSAGGVTKPKSEMEKAMEAFARADEVGIEEEGEGIIETRMLRASEVQELMGEVKAQPQMNAAPSSTPPPATPPPATPTPPPSGPPGGAPTTPATPPGAAPAAPATPATPPSGPVQEKVTTPKSKPIAPPPMPEARTEMPKPTPPPSKPAAKPAPASIPQIESIISSLPDPAYRQDPQIIGIVNDLKNQYTELAQFISDLNTVRTRLESEVQDYWNIAEVKRIQFESLEEQLRLAKHEWNDTTKVYQQAEKRMKNEVSSREKRIKDIEKRIEKTESQIEKRVKDLDKEKEKQG
jgi:hypothetical protein